MTREEFLREEIESYRRKITLFQGIIAEWERELQASPTTAQTSQHRTADNSVTQSAVGNSRNNSSEASVLSLVRDWMFFNKSQPDAAKQLLEMANHPLSTETILEALEKGGLKIGGENPKAKKQNLYTVLARAGHFGRAAADTWGLPAWPNVTPVKNKRGRRPLTMKDAIEQNTSPEEQTEDMAEIDIKTEAKK